MEFQLNIEGILTTFNHLPIPSVPPQSPLRGLGLRGNSKHAGQFPSLAKLKR